MKQKQPKKILLEKFYQELIYFLNKNVEVTTCNPERRHKGIITAINPINLSLSLLYEDNKRELFHYNDISRVRET